MTVIHRLQITPEAAFDIFDSLGLVGFDTRLLKTELEEYITRKNAAGRLPWWGYFRCDWYDEGNDRWVKLFIRKGMTVGIMQYWNLAGVCFLEDWTDELEDEGIIRAWLDTRVEDIPNEEDAAVRLRVWETLKNTNKTVFENFLEEVKNEFVNQRDKEAAEKLAFLQSIHFRVRGRKRPAKKD